MEARFNADTYHENDIGVRADPKGAAHWYKKAAKQGHPTAQFALGLCFRHGTGVEAAVRWYKKAVKQDQRDAQYYPHGCYKNDIGIEAAVH